MENNGFELLRRLRELEQGAASMEQGKDLGVWVLALAVRQLMVEVGRLNVAVLQVLNENALAASPEAKENFLEAQATITKLAEHVATVIRITEPPEARG